MGKGGNANQGSKMSGLGPLWAPRNEITTLKISTGYIISAANSLIWLFLFSPLT